MTLQSAYSSFARGASRLCGRPYMFAVAATVIAAWAVTGPLFGFSDTWQLVINTGTTIVTFLMVFLIHNAQSRDTEAIQVKLDELIRATKGAHNGLLDVEDLEEGAISDLRDQYVNLAQSARGEGAEGAEDATAAAGAGDAADVVPAVRR